LISPASDADIPDPVSVDSSGSSTVKAASETAFTDKSGLGLQIDSHFALGYLVPLSFPQELWLALDL